VRLKCNKFETYNKFYSTQAALPFSSPRVLSTKRIGPHNYKVLSILIGSLLGDGHMERDGQGSRFCFYFFLTRSAIKKNFFFNKKKQKGSHIEYLL
jgi:hypothetical protein